MRLAALIFFSASNFSAASVRCPSEEVRRKFRWMQIGAAKSSVEGAQLMQQRFLESGSIPLYSLPLARHPETAEDWRQKNGKGRMGTAMGDYRWRGKLRR